MTSYRSQGLAPRRRVEERLNERIQARPRPLASYALQADARPFDQQEKLVGDALRLEIAGRAHQRHKALALATLVCLDHAARRMARLGELDGGVGEGAAAAGAFEVRNMLQEIAQLRPGAAGMRCARRVPERVAFAGELAKVRRHQLVLGGEMAIKRHLVGPGGSGDRLDAHRADAVAIEKFARRAQYALARWRLAGPC